MPLIVAVCYTNNNKYCCFSYAKHQSLQRTDFEDFRLILLLSLAEQFLFSFSFYLFSVYGVVPATRRIVL